MNKRYYRNYERYKQRWYFISYNFLREDGRGGFGSIELKISGKPNLKAVEKYIAERNSEFKNVIVLALMPTRKRD